MLLKTVMIPNDPVEGLVERYMTMYADDLSVSGFQKILDLKGLRKQKQQLLIDVLQHKMSLMNNGAPTLQRRPSTSRLKEGFGKWIKLSK